MGSIYVTLRHIHSVPFVLRQAIQFRLFLPTIIVTFLLFSSIGIKRGYCEDQHEPDLLAAISVHNSAIDEWLTGANFRSIYVMLEGDTANKSAALIGDFVESPRRSTGLFHKAGDKIRITQDFDSPLIRLDGAKGGLGPVANLGFDEISVGDFSLSYLPRQSSDRGTCLVTRKRDDIPVGSLVAGVQSNGILGPFACAAIRFEQFRDIELLNGVNSKLKDISIESLETSSLRISLTRDEQIYQERVVVELWTEPNPPVVDNYSLVQTFPDGDTAELYVHASRFVDCTGFMVPQQVRTVMRSTQKGAWHLREWLSEDLGQQTPLMDDFVIDIPLDVKIIGLRAKPPVKNKLLHIDLSTIVEGDLVAKRPEAGIPSPPASASSSIRTPIILANVILFLLIAVWWWLQKRMNRPPA